MVYCKEEVGCRIINMEGKYIFYGSGMHKREGKQVVNVVNRSNFQIDANPINMQFKRRSMTQHFEKVSRKKKRIDLFVEIR